MKQPCWQEYLSHDLPASHLTERNKMTDLLINKDTIHVGDTVIEVEMARLDHSRESMSRLAFSYGKEKSFDVFVKVAPDRYELDGLVEQVKAVVRNLVGNCADESYIEMEMQCVNWAKYQVGTLAVEQLSTGVVKADFYYITIDATLRPILNTLDSRAEYLILLYQNHTKARLSHQELTDHLNEHASTPIYQVTKIEIISRGECEAGKCDILDRSNIWVGGGSSLLLMLDKTKLIANK